MATQRGVHPPAELAANPQYEILRELGRGGMGVVYLAKNKIMDRLEVLKVINKTLLEHPGAAERFLREIRSAAKLSHANVVAAYHALQVGELLAFAMEYIEGQDLASVVKAQGPLPVLHACYYAQQAALGLQHAFEKGMVHRDIKPQNLILAREGRKHLIKVLDFGLAKATREKSEDTGLTGEGKMLGTPDYIAPEQSLDAAKADIRADIYSLGCTLYYLLSGRPPFSASSLGAVLLAHQMQEAKPLNLVRPEVPEELAAVVRQMMAKDPGKRYQTPLEVVQALTPFIKPASGAALAPRVPPAAELSSGPVETKPANKKAARVDPPSVPAAPEAKKPPEPAEVWGALKEDSIASVAPRKSAVIRKRRAATVRERTAPNKWLMSGGIGVGMLLMLLLGMWIGGFFKAKMPDTLPDSITNSIDMKLVLVKPGTFLMGSPASEEDRNDEINQMGGGGGMAPLVARMMKQGRRSEDEEQHEVEITRPFYMGVYEVTQEQYERVMGQNPSYFSSTGGGMRGGPLPGMQGGGGPQAGADIPQMMMPRLQETQEQRMGVRGGAGMGGMMGGVRGGGAGMGGNDKVQGMDTRQFPVESVSWEEADAFCRKLSELSEEKANGRTYRLPTEAEWEYCCRGGPLFTKPSPPFHFGNSLSSTQANFNGNEPFGGAPKGPYLERTEKVGSFPANSLGLHDLHGNVREWCADWYDAEYYKRSPRQNPQGLEPTGGRVLRGGSWNDYGGGCRSACRDSGAPGDRNHNTGFRVVFVLAARK